MSPFSPTPEQHIALTHPAPLLVLAGAGTGKTTVLTRRIAELIVSGRARPDQVLALTFTDKAAAEMAERLSAVLGEHGMAGAARDVLTTTFHSFGSMVIRENLLQLGFDRPPGLLSGAAAWQLLASIFDELIFDAVEISIGQPAADFAHLLHVISQCKDHLVTPEDLESYARGLDPSMLAPLAAEYLIQKRGEMRDVAAAYRRFEAAKKEKGLVDFGDHLLLPVRLFGSHPAVRDAYRRRFPFVFVDEYQDTNHVQRLLLLELLDPASPSVMVIGDDDQAIYRWRGAVVHNILRFPQERIFAPEQVTSVPMTLNRRSFPPILELSNLAISEVQDRHPKTLGYHDDNRYGQATIGHHLATSDRSEGRWIAEKIRELEPETRAYPGNKRGYGAFAILCRKRSLFEPIAQALQQENIPYELIGGTGFYGRWEIRDVLSYLRVLADPSDDLATARILRSRRWRLSGRDMFHLGQWVRRQNGDRGREGEALEDAARLHLFDALLQHEGVAGLAPEACRRLKRLRAELECFADEKMRLSLSELVARLMEVTGYRRELGADPGPLGRAAQLNLDKLVELARQLEEGAAEASLEEFVQYVSYALESPDDEDEVRPVDEDADTVKVMTVHQSKGLEFPVVFIPALSRDIFPTRPRDQSDIWWELPRELRGDREHLPALDLVGVRTASDLKRAKEQRKSSLKALQMDEERRLFYVAVTRAERHLYLSRAHWHGMTVKPREPSIFWQLVEDSGLSVDLGQEDCPEENPSWALAASDDTSRAEEPAGSELASSDLLLGRDGPDSWIEETARREGCGRWTVLRAEVDAHIRALIVARAPRVELTPVEISCTALVQYLFCPRYYRYVYRNRLPTRPSVSRSIGLEVHRRIEELSRAGALAVKDHVGEDGVAEDEQAETYHWMDNPAENRAPRVTPAEMLQNYQKSVYGGRPATYVEYPFHLSLSAGLIRGRIDRLDRRTDGTWEIVDFKSGAPAPDVPPHYRRQLGLYALAVREACDVPAAQIAAHLFFLSDGSDVPVVFDDSQLNMIRTEAEEAMASIGRGEFPMAVDRQGCAGCDYGHVCGSNTSIART